MKQIATFAIVSFMALFSQSNARASICNRAYNNLSDRFSDNTNKQFEPDSVVERKVLEEGDTVYRYMPKPRRLGANHQSNAKQIAQETSVEGQPAK